MTVSDEEFEKNVEAAVSAIAQENLKAESESSTSAHATPRASTDAERQAHHEHAQRKEGVSTTTTSAGDGENAPVAGLLRTIQKPLSTIGRMFADEPEQGSSGQPQPATAAGPGAGPGPVPGPRPAGFDAQEAAARQASAEAAEARKIQRAEHKDVVE